MSYPVYRRRHVVASVAPVVRRVKPAAAIVQAGTPIPIVERLLRLRVPTILYLHDVEFADLGGDLRAHERLASWRIRPSLPPERARNSVCIPRWCPR
jgi:hypothetical protein